MCYRKDRGSKMDEWRLTKDELPEAFESVLVCNQGTRGRTLVRIPRVSGSIPDIPFSSTSVEERCIAIVPGRRVEPRNQAT